jgi:hypothetical protein
VGEVLVLAVGVGELTPGAKAPEFGWRIEGQGLPRSKYVEAKAKLEVKAELEAKAKSRGISKSRYLRADNKKER